MIEDPIKEVNEMYVEEDGRKIHYECPLCHKLVRINKIIGGSLHWCIDGVAEVQFLPPEVDCEG